MRTIGEKEMSTLVEIGTAIDTKKETVVDYIVTGIEFFGHFAQMEKIASARNQATAIPRKHRTDLNKEIKEVREEVLTENNQKKLKVARNNWKSLLARKSNLSDTISDLSEPYKQPAKEKGQAMESCLIDMFAQIQSITGKAILPIEGIPESRLNKMIAIQSAKQRASGHILSVAPIQI